MHPDAPSFSPARLRHIKTAAAVNILVVEPFEKAYQAKLAFRPPRSSFRTPLNRQPCRRPQQQTLLLVFSHRQSPPR